MPEKMQKFLDRFESRLSLWILAGGPALAGAITGYTASFSDWVASFGSFAWLLFGLLAALLMSIIVLIGLEARYRSQRSRAIRRWQEASELVNPLDDVFTKRRISLADIADPITSEIKGKTFTDCQLNGPAVLLSVGTTFINVGFYNCDVIALKRGEVRICNAIKLVGSQVVRGRIANATILADADSMRAFNAMGIIPITENPL